MGAPLLTRIRFRVALWSDARLLPFRIGHRPLADVLALAPPGARNTYRDLPLAYILKYVRRSLRKPWLMRERPCLREGLLAFRFMTAAGYEPELHFGLDRTSLGGSDFKAHCWVVHRGETVLNPPDANMVRILIHGGTTAANQPARTAA
jgi:hypothetical protein